MLVIGNKYSTSDLMYTQLVGNIDETSEDFPGYYCIQWTSDSEGSTEPLYDQTHTELLSEVSTTADGTTGVASPDSYKFMADFNLHFEPSAKIVEIPVGMKTLKVVDNPPNGASVMPFQVMNNSQQVGFKIDYKSFSVKDQYPKPISLMDSEHRRHYSTAYDLIDYGIGYKDQINRISTSPHRS